MIVFFFFLVTAVHLSETVVKLMSREGREQHVYFCSMTCFVIFFGIRITSQGSNFFLFFATFWYVRSYLLLFF